MGNMSNDIFDRQILTEKLLKLNNSQQSIESLSCWCISHQKKAKEIVETWDKLFNSSQKEQHVSFLYLANDIMQNSRRKGSDFVNEFWIVLPAALRHVYENGGEHGRKAVSRLVDIWEERKVFGSRGQDLKDKMMSKNPHQSSASNENSPNPIKIVKKDGHSVRIKLAVGCLPEKILTAFQSVLDEHFNEEAALNKCSATVYHVGKITDDIENTLAQGNQPGSTLVNNLQEQENELQKYVTQLENSEAARASLLSQINCALQEQESRQELVRAQLLATRGLIEQAVNMRKRFNQAAEATKVLEQNSLSIPANSTPPQPPFTQTLNLHASLSITEAENKKAAAAALAAKLAASTPSALMLTSVLSSLVAEEAASTNSSLKPTGFNSEEPMFNPKKRPKIEKPLPVSGISSSDRGSSSFFTTLQQSLMSNMPVAPSPSLQSTPQANQLQSTFTRAHPLPLLFPSNQYVQSTGLMLGGIPFGYGSNNLPSLPLRQTQQQQQPATGGFYRPPGIGYHGQGHASTLPPIPRQ